MNMELARIARIGFHGLIAAGAPLWLACFAPIAYGQSQAPIEELTELSLEDLINIEITTVSKTEEQLADAAAAAYVITREDMQRAGVSTIADALRLAPGVQVLQIDSSRWAIGIRGFADRYSNKLLVLIDGRSVYNPFFSGVYWDIQDLVLDDIERIEVIRGPGGALWGANAVNGVINIITRHSRDTQGGYINMRGGNEETNLTEFRWGGELGDQAYYRLFGKFINRDASTALDGGEAHDEWDQRRAGFRIDWEPSERDAFEFHGGIYDGESDGLESFPIPSPPYMQNIYTTELLDGAYLLSRWERELAEDSNLSAQFYYDRARRSAITTKTKRDTLDFEIQHQFTPWQAHEILWGFGHRITFDDITSTDYFVYEDAERNYQLFNAFLQDKIDLIADELTLTLGGKIEHNDFTGFEFQPSAKLMWSPHEQHRFWTSAARAVRTPSRAEHDTSFGAEAFPPGHPDNDAPLTALAVINGNSGFESESLIALEGGYRYLPSESLYFDFAVFYNQYDDLRTGEIGESIFRLDAVPPHILVLLDVANEMTGETYGAELAIDWRPFDWWTIKSAFTILDIQLHPETQTPSSDRVEAEEGLAPHYQASILQTFNLSNDVDLNLWARYVDKLSGYNVSSYIGIDAQIRWRPDENLELAVGGRNLLESSHREFTPESFFTQVPAEIDRSVYAQVTWRF